ncbi:MAG TPA: ACP synthase, partial [Polyangia bacterium]|nr:ACP synthase [Polyangia bacterium]
HRYLLSLSIDQHGEVTPLYPEAGASLPVPDGAERATRYLPDSLELTGTGIERIIVLLSDQPIDVEAARRSARAAYDQAGGDLSRLPRLALPGEEFERTFAKP